MSASTRTRLVLSCSDDPCIAVGPRPARALRWLALAAGIATATVASEAEPIFPEPLHLTRTIEDPVSGTTSTVDEFYEGNRVVRIAGDLVTITDYANETVTEIDRHARTWSEASFDEVAAAAESLGQIGAAREPAPSRPRLERIPSRAVVGRTTETHRARFDDRPDGLESIMIAVDPSILLSRAALEAVAGAAHPSRHTPLTETLLAVSRRPTRDDLRPEADARNLFALPLERIVVWRVEGDELRLVDRVTAIAREPVNPQLLLVSPDFARVENRTVKMERLLEELDQLPGVPERSP